MNVRANAIGLAVLTVAGVLSSSALAASFTSGYVIGSNSITPSGQTLFVDNALTGGGDARHDGGATDWAAVLGNAWLPGDNVSLTGIAIPIFAGAGTTNTTVNGTFTLNFYDIGSDNDFTGTANETLLGSTTISFGGQGTTGTSAYFANFDSPLAFTALGSGVAISFANTASLRLKINTAATAPTVTREALGTGNPVGGANPAFRMSLAGINAGNPNVNIWVPSAGGSWGNASNWSLNTVPNASGLQTILGSAATTPSTVTLDGAQTVGSLRMDNANAYTVAAGTGGSLTLDNGAASASIVATGADHSITAPITLASNTSVEVAATRTLTLDSVSGGGSLTKTGSGTLTLPVPVSHGGGTTINGGTIVLGNGSATTVGLSSITIGTTGTLDYRNQTSNYSVSDFAVGNTGTVRVGSGTLVVSGSGGSVGEITQPNVVVASGATVDASAFTTNYELGIGQSLRLGGTMIAPNLTVFGDNPVGVGDDTARAIGTAHLIGNLALDGSFAATSDGLVFELKSPAVSSVNDVLEVSGAVTHTGANASKITIIAPDGALSGSYDLLRYNGAAVGNSAFQLVLPSTLLNSRVVYAVDATQANVVKLASTGTAMNLTWVGDGATNQWDLNNTANFVQTGTSNPEKFYNLDTVTFDDSSANKNVLLNNSLLAGQVIVNTAGTYVFTNTANAEGLTGNSPIVKRGAGKLTVAYNLDFTAAGTTIYTGAISVEQGTLSLGGGITGATGNLSATSGVTLASGATLELFRTGAPATVAAYNFPVLGSGTIVKMGDTCSLGGINAAWDGELRVEGGQLNINTTTAALGTTVGGVVVTNDGILRLNLPAGYEVNDAITINSTPASSAAQLAFGNGTTGAVNGLVSFQVAGGVTVDNGSAVTLAGGVNATGNLNSDGAGNIRLGLTSVAGNLTRTSPLGTLTLNADSSVGGTLAVATANGGIAIAASASAALPVTVNVGGLALTGGGTGTTRVDLTNGVLKVNYSGGSPLAAIKQLILDGQDDDNGAGGPLDAGEAVIYSSLLPIAGQAVGYYDSGTFVSVRKSVLGDTNVDGLVNFDDLLVLAQNYNLAAGAEWFKGDFNYDSAVNFDDLLTLAQNYNASLSLTMTALGDAGVSSSFSSDFAMALSVVPEPTSLTVLAAGAAVLGRRRRSIR